MKNSNNNSSDLSPIPCILFKPKDIMKACMNALKRTIKNSPGIVEENDLVISYKPLKLAKYIQK